MGKDNLVLQKSYQFAIESIQLYKKLQKSKEYTIGKQLLCSGTFIGANVEETIGGHSRSDFSYKISIAYKEAREAHYWLRLLRDTHYLSQAEADRHIYKADELTRILGSIQKTLRDPIIPKS